MSVWRRLSRPNQLLGAMLLAGVLAAGCGEAPGPERFDIQGAVNFKGTPVPYGVIQFTPDMSKGNSGPSGFAQIVDGKYDTRTASSGRGITGGVYLVTINGSDRMPGTDDAVIRRLFQEYRTTVDLTKESGTVDFEIPQ